MDRLNQHGMPASLNVDVAQGTQCHSPAGVEGVQQSFGGPLAELLLNHPKQVRLNAFELKTGPVIDAAATICLLGSATLERLGDQATPLGQWLMGPVATSHNVTAVAVPGDHMTTIGDINLGIVIASLDSTALVQTGITRGATTG